MDPAAERDVGGAGCEPAEVDLSLEPLRLAGVDQDGKHEDTDENEDEVSSSSHAMLQVQVAERP